MSRVLDSGLRDEAIDVVLGLPAVVEMLRQSPLEQLSERLKGHFFSVDLSPAVRRHGARLAEDRIGLAQLIATPAETQALDQLRKRLRELDSQREEAEAKVKQHEVHSASRADVGVFVSRAASYARAAFTIWQRA